MSLASTAERLKKVMRIALLGIRPADQILLKGYLRVLLRLEADLEWVSANSSQVDLFMINEEFQQAESVQRLLASLPNAPVLYITRDELDQGRLVGNKLTLPLKEIDQLNYWLFNNVQFLKSQGTNLTALPVTNTVTPDSNLTPTSPKTLEQIIASRSQATATSTNPSLNQTISQPDLPPATPTMTDKNSLIDSLKTLQQRSDTIFALKQNQHIIAYINPKFQRVWLIDNTASLSMEWELVATTQHPPIIAQPPIDLVQWLWEKSTSTPIALTSLLQANERYRITSWLKPLDDEYRHDYLKIQGLLESRDSTIAEIVHTAQVSHEIATRGVAGLLVAGLMRPNIYSNLSKADNTKVTSSAQGNLSAQSAPPTQPTGTSANPAATPNTAATTTASQSAPAIEQDEGMKGFLSKLRRKLGL